MHKSNSPIQQSQTNSTSTPVYFTLPASETASHELSEQTKQRIPIQFKLNIGAVDDPLEEEADAMAEKVMRMPEQTFIQHKCAHCEEEEKVQRKPLASFIQRKADAGNVTTTEAVSNQIQSMNGGGSPMPQTTRTFMESRFGTDFSGVRIHSGDKAAYLSHQLQAQAFTVGGDIYFNKNKFSPETNSGKHLLAHELTHTIQQQKSIQQSPQIRRQTATTPSIPTTDPPVPASPSSDLMTIMESQVAIDAYATQLRDAVLAPLVRPGRSDAISFLNTIARLTPVQADHLLSDEEFRRVIRTRLSGRNIWTVFTRLHFRNHIPEPHLRLSLAVSRHDARLLTDMLSLVVTTYHGDRYYNWLRESAVVEFRGDPLLNEIIRLIDHRNDPGIGQRLAGNYSEIHYEQNAAGAYALRQFGGNVSADSYISGNELRVIVRMNFQDGNDTVGCPTTGAAGCQPFNFPGTYADKYSSWQDQIRNVWNRRFYVTNGTNRYDIVFVPVFLSGPDAAATKIRAMTNASLRCSPNLQPGRSQQDCWFMNVGLSTVSHEFGHILGASDEYNLPGSNQEIINSGVTGMSVQDMTLSSMEGVTGSPQPVNPNKTAYGSNTQMGHHNISTRVEARHLTRLIMLLNAGRPPGTPAFTLVSGTRPTTP
jgi:hypothetical protein